MLNTINNTPATIESYRDTIGAMRLADLRFEARESGATCYSTLRKADLLDLLVNTYAGMVGDTTTDGAPADDPTTDATTDGDATTGAIIPTDAATLAAIAREDMREACEASGVVAYDGAEDDPGVVAAFARAVKLLDLDNMISPATHAGGSAGAWDVAIVSNPGRKAEQIIASYPLRTEQSRVAPALAIGGPDMCPSLYVAPRGDMTRDHAYRGTDGRVYTCRADRAGNPSPRVWTLSKLFRRGANDAHGTGAGMVGRVLQNAIVDACGRATIGAGLKYDVRLMARVEVSASVQS